MPEGILYDCDFAFMQPILSLCYTYDATNVYITLPLQMSSCSSRNVSRLRAGDLLRHTALHILISEILRVGDFHHIELLELVVVSHYTNPAHALRVMK